ncbi:MAG: hypothetical protein ABJC62_00650 [Frankiaceae bacterium]
MPALVARLSQNEPLDTRSRGRLIGSLAAGLASSAKRAGAAAVTSGRWLSEVVIEVAPQLPIRDLGALREQYDGLDGDVLAESLITAATRATAAVGAAGGAVAAIEFVAPPALLTAPVLVAAETLAVVAIEVKLLAELHEVYRRRPQGSAAQRATAYVLAWASQRGIDPHQKAGLTGAVGGALQRQLRQRLMRRAGRNVTTYLPFLAGAVAGGELNRRETRRFAEAMLAELRG